MFLMDVLLFGLALFGLVLVGLVSGYHFKDFCVQGEYMILDYGLYIATCPNMSDPWASQIDVLNLCLNNVDGALTFAENNVPGYAGATCNECFNHGEHSTVVTCNCKNNNGEVHYSTIDLILGMEKRRWLTQGLATNTDDERGLQIAIPNTIMCNGFVGTLAALPPQKV
ncbi:hypothetical protein B0T26DRAFT_764260 [Lasiosphaeria miniovina]|uniref:Cyanovirin-N domain-containing protein n=1 Tax=Lasiosphaeria miniovina TaxID=1954250 RepID=A0AA40B398_9PEZI|nr:uncharacterized protein B0T26DRAFT_764260 [Lasiosphaeria miniovina]KAK0726894.1 hypothetical protein B0T26DRAFT_764260 [Lasiosphaeria miniovina]